MLGNFIIKKIFFSINDEQITYSTYPFWKQKSKNVTE